MSNGQSEDFIQGDLVVRHSLYVRVLHWSVAVFFFLSLFSGWALFSPRLYFLTGLFGGGYSTRLLHPWFAVLFSLGMVPLFFRWLRHMAWQAGDSHWVRHFKDYVSYREVPAGGKFNAGQKMFFWSVAVGGIVLLLTGIVMWLPTSFPIWLRYISYPLHDIGFIALGVGVIYHVYLSWIALGGTLRAMTRGTVTRHWAQNHHARWYQEVSRK
jgi:formate dehydrogenase subunit gamma